VTMRVRWIALTTMVVFAVEVAWAGDLVKIKIPRHSELTPVQRLNREGVDAIREHKYDRASSLFYKAYLYDPADPFTLNNLGYVSELEGELERAQQFYALASTQSSNASIDRSNVKQIEGSPMQIALQGRGEGAMRVNWMNVEAMKFLSQSQSLEAVAVLQQAQAIDPHNPFTENNLGVAYESLGEFDNALRAYDAVALTNSTEAVVMAADPKWRGKPVSVMAAESAKRLQQRIAKMGSADAQAAMLSERGVAAVNENDWTKAKQDFLHAYSIDPSSAFSLNNRGYVAEMEGDLESAQYFYDKALKARDASARVGLATQGVARGAKLFSVATDSNFKVDAQLARYSQQRHQEQGTIELTPRNGATDGDPAAVPERSLSPNAPLEVTQPMPQLQ